MLRWTLTLLSALCVAWPALADAQKTQHAYLVKTNFPGFTLPEYRWQQTCSVYLDRAEIVNEYGLGTDELMETRQILNMRSEGAVEASIAKAKDENLIRKPSFICDAPSTVITAYLTDANGDPEAVPLYSSGGCGSDQLERRGPFTDRLLDIINTICPKTVTFE